MDHVNTQLPYAIVVGVVAVVLGNFLTAFGLPWPLAILSGVAILGVGLRFLGRPSH